jgi:hypothetical protein
MNLAMIARTSVYRYVTKLTPCLGDEYGWGLGVVEFSALFRGTSLSLVASRGHTRGY